MVLSKKIKTIKIVIKVEVLTDTDNDGKFTNPNKFIVYLPSEFDPPSLLINMLEGASSS